MSFSVFREPIPGNLDINVVWIMRIDCYIASSCSSEEALKKNIAAAVRLESVDADVNFHDLDEAEAERRGLMGSPSILIDGEDVLPGEIPGIS